MAAAFNIHSNYEAFVNELSNRKSELAQAATLAMAQGMREFEAKIIKDYYSGRVSDNVGLNRQTGALARGWHIMQSIGNQGLNASVKLANSEKYGAIHQYGGTIRAINGPYLTFKIRNTAYSRRVNSKGEHRKVTVWNWVRVTSVKIPKRTYVIESFRTSGFDMIKNRVVGAINRILRERGKKGA